MCTQLINTTVINSALQVGAGRRHRRIDAFNHVGLYRAIHGPTQLRAVASVLVPRLTTHFTDCLSAAAYPIGIGGQSSSSSIVTMTVSCTSFRDFFIPSCIQHPRQCVLGKARYTFAIKPSVAKTGDKWRRYVEVDRRRLVRLCQPCCGRRCRQS